MADLKFLLDGNEINPPLEWRDIQIIAAWINGSVQPNIVSDDFTFVNEAAEKILTYVAGGASTTAGLFRGMPFQILANDPVDGTLVVFDGFIDFLEGYELIRPNQVRVRISRPEDIELLSKKLEALSFGYLFDKGHIKGSDFTKIPYVVQKIVRGGELFPLLLAELFIAKEVAEGIKNIGETIAAFVPPTTTLGVVKAILELIYLASMIVALLKIFKKIMELLFPQPHIQQSMNLRELLTKAFSFLGLGFNSNIKELDYLYYIPSRQDIGFIRRKQFKLKDVSTYWRSAIPNISDYGYRCSDMVNLSLELFNAQLIVENNTVFMLSENDPQWIRNAKYVLPDVLLDRYTYNLADAVGTKLFSFQTDPMDEWTIEDFTGTN